MQINVKSNISTFAKAIDAFGRDQIPFATAMALNDTAKDVRGKIINDTWPSEITQRQQTHHF